MRCFLTIALLLLAVPAFAQDDETDKTVHGQRQFQWMKILRESNEVLMRGRAITQLSNRPGLRRARSSRRSALPCNSTRRRSSASRLRASLAGSVRGQWIGPTSRR